MFKYEPERTEKAFPGNQVDPHDTNKEEQTADIARNEILSCYPQVKP